MVEPQADLRLCVLMVCIFSLLAILTIILYKVVAVNVLIHSGNFSLWR